MLATPSLRGCTLLLAIALAGCGGGSGSGTASADATAPASSVATVPPVASAPVTQAAPQAETAAVAAVAPAAAGGGDQVYQKTCAMCHGTPAMGAPVVGNKADWSERIAQGKDTLYLHALEGFTGAKGMMPARGGNTTLDDASVKAAVDYMVTSSQ